MSKGGFSGHLSDYRLRELAASSLGESGYVELTSVLMPEESVHFRECPECIDALANVVREMIRQREKEKAEENESE